MNTPNNNNLAEARRTTNLRVLQRLDPQIVDLAITASHVVLYQFSLQTQQWVKRNVEGSLFVCKRSQVPRFTLIVSNRNSTENLEVGITSTFQMQVREPYLIFRDSAAASSASSAAAGSSADEAIRGLWFHDDKEREQVHSYLENVVKSLQKIEQMERENGPPPSLLMTPNKNDNDDGNNVNNASTTTTKTNKGPPVEVNTNAAGAALLSTLTLNDNTKTTTTAIRSRKKQPPSTSSPSSSPPPTTTTTTQSNNTTTTTTTPSSSSLSTQSSNNNTLDKKSLQLALLSLIQDERFLDLIHAQYLKVASSRAQREQQQQQQQQQNNLHR